MEQSSDHGLPQHSQTDCVIVGVFQTGQLSAAAKALDEAADGQLRAACEGGDMEGRAGQTLLLRGLPNIAAERVLLVGCGQEKKLDEGAYLKAVGAAVKLLDGGGACNAACCLAQLPVKGRDLAWRITNGVIEAQRSLYRFDRMRSKKEPPKKPLAQLVWLTADGDREEPVVAAVEEGRAVAAGIALARDLGNLPGNVCTPSYLGEQAHALADQFPALQVQVLEQGEIEELKMGAFLSVTKGSREPPRFIIMSYRGAPDPDARPVVLVGKGVTFDAGGISIKPAAAMDEMKFDMCGAASVFGAMHAVLALGLPINLVGLVPACENLPDGAANKPGDIVTSMSGKTIEVLNTDAEGRLILCDALTYSERFKPAAVVDIATLTGACVIALGRHASGLYSNQAALARQLVKAGKASFDRVWEMPLWEDYQEQLKSPFADLANIGGREAGSVTAACFLARFTRKLTWAHLDIAGTAWLSGGEQKGSTGRPVALLVQFLIDRCRG